MAPSTSTSTSTTYYIEHDDFFKYIKEFLKEESSHTYYKKYITKDNTIRLSSESDPESDPESDEFY
jgi:hypothetical protein